MRLKTGWIGLVVICLLGVTGCFENPNDVSKQGVCVQKVAVWAEASSQSKWLSGLELGETVQLLESKPVKDEKDPKQPEYFKVKLSDGTIGYCNTWGIVKGAYVGVIQNPSKVFKRPDLLADAGQSFEIMSIVAVQEEKDDWLRVTGEKWAKSGWITKDSIRKDKEDVVTAIILKKALSGKENKMSKEDLEKIIATVPDRDNYFVTKVLEKYQALDTTPLDSPAAVVPDTDTPTDGESQEYIGD